MINIYELMKMFNLDEKPYIQLGCEWCTDGSRIYFVEDDVLYAAVQGEMVGKSQGVVCILNDVQQLLGWQPAIFSQHLEVSYEDFERKYGEGM